ncbi:MAG: hypothetical protein PUE14_10640 [Clostridia bacterium]|nr:hypothetical protein [Clostridia bacterium]
MNCILYPDAVQVNPYLCILKAQKVKKGAKPPFARLSGIVFLLFFCRRQPEILSQTFQARFPASKNLYSFPFRYIIDGGNQTDYQAE